MAVSDEEWVRPQVLVRASLTQVDVHNLLQPARPRAEHRNSLAEIDGFFDAMGDEDNRLARRPPDPEKLVLKLFS